MPQNHQVQFRKRKKGQHSKSNTDSNIACSDRDAAASDDGQPDQKRIRTDGDEDVEDEESGCELEQAEQPQICVSMVCNHGRLGGAFYEPTTATLYILEDTTESMHFDLTKMFLEHSTPRIIITGSKSDENFIEFIQKFTASTETILQIRPNREFTPAKGRERLLLLRILSTFPQDVGLTLNQESVAPEDGHRNAYEFMRKKSMAGDPGLHAWNSTIRLSNYFMIENSPVCVSAAGALLDHLARIHAVGNLEDEGVPGLDIRSIEPIKLDEIMHINSDALSSLQIFEDEHHASIHSDKTKEGLSLFAILNSTRTTLGRRLLRSWFLHPSVSLSTIISRHDAVSCFLRPENLLTAGIMHGHLRGIGNISHVLSLLHRGKASLREWQAVVKFVYHASLLKDVTKDLSLGSSIDVVKKLLSTLDLASLRDIGNAVNETIDWEASSNAGRVCVRPHIDEELDEWKRIFHGLDSVLSRVATQMGTTIPPDYAESLNVVYFPQLGFLICVPLRDEWRNDEGMHVPQPPTDEFIFQFCTEKSAYFKSPKMQDLDYHIGDLHPAIVDREIEIVQRLEEKVLAHESVVAAACDICAELDCLLSFAEASRTYEYVRPHMVADNIIDIKLGRHPLQERVVDTFVPNDALIVGGKGFRSPERSFSGAEDQSGDEEIPEKRSIILCTGANACGKSVYLKQTALIVYMAQIGCFVPAESATLGIVDKVFTRVQTRESVSKVQSAFIIDLNQVSFALRNMTPRSLLIVDEFGKDGAGMFCGLLKYLLSLGPSCPKVLAATHFHDLFRDDFLALSLPISFVHMQILLTSKDGHALDLRTDGEEDQEGRRLVAPGEPITYLYKVTSGVYLESCASECALAFGIAPRLVRRAQHVTDLLSAHAVGQLLDEKMTREEQADLEESESVCRRLLQWDLFPGHGDGRGTKEKLREVLGRQGDDDVNGK